MTAPSLGTVLVTGGAGFIGTTIAQRVEADARWLAVDSLNPRIHEQPGRPARLPEHVDLLEADITEPETWDRALDGFSPDVVLHLASETDTGLSLDHVTRFSHVNVTGTARMLDALQASGRVPRRIVVASSRAVYGEGSWERADGSTFSPGQRRHEQLESGQWDFADASPLPSVAETTPERPTSVYGATKLAQESLLSAWCGARGVGLTILRLQNVYGPGQSLINPYTGILPLFTRLAASGEAIPVYEDGAMRRDFVHVDDVAEAFRIVLDPARDAADVEIFDIGTGTGAVVGDVARMIAGVVDAPEPVVTGQFRDGDVRHTWCDTAAAEEGLGWRAAISWEQGIGDYVRWYLDRPVAEATR